MKSLSGSTLRDVLRRSFGFLPAVGILAGLVLGFVLPVVDRALRIDFGIFSFTERDSARSLLETIASVTVSVAGVGFSVTIVAFTLASQQLSPRVLRTFQANRLSQVTLAVFVGSFVYCLVLLSALGDDIPDLAMVFAIVLVIAAFALFVAFIHDIIGSLEPSTLIRRIATDARTAVAGRYPARVGEDPADVDAAEREAEALMLTEAVAVRAARAGFLVSVEGDALITAAREHEGIVRQRAQIGDFVITGSVLAEAWSGSDAPGLAASVRGAFRQEDERTIVQDVAFPIRQLSDVALKGLSPSLNDPTTAENAIDSLTDTLIVFIRTKSPPRVRVDRDGRPRLVARAPALGDLVRLGFEQVRVKAASYPVVAGRMLFLLGELRREARDNRLDDAEILRQARLIAEGPAGETPTEADVEGVREAHRRFEGR